MAYMRGGVCTSTSGNSLDKVIAQIDPRIDMYPLQLIPVDDPIANNPNIFDLEGVRRR